MNKKKDRLSVSDLEDCVLAGGGKRKYSRFFAFEKIRREDERQPRRCSRVLETRWWHFNARMDHVLTYTISERPPSSSHGLLVPLLNFDRGLQLVCCCLLVSYSSLTVPLVSGVML